MVAHQLTPSVQANVTGQAVNVGLHGVGDAIEAAGAPEQPGHAVEVAAQRLRLRLTKGLYQFSPQTRSNSLLFVPHHLQLQIRKHSGQPGDQSVVQARQVGGSSHHFAQMGVTEGQALQQQRLHLEETGRDQYGHHVVSIQLGPRALAWSRQVLALGTVLDPLHQPVEDENVAVHGYVHLLQALAGSYIRKVTHFGDEQMLRAGEVLRGVLHLIANVDNHFRPLNDFSINLESFIKT